jgi:hypothetical protein
VRDSEPNTLKPRQNPGRKTSCWLYSTSTPFIFCVPGTLMIWEKV